jgi:type I restriction enzyme S subunit
MRDGLPLGWAATTLDAVGYWQSGSTPSRRNSAYFGQGIPWVKSGDLPDGPVLSTEEQLTELGLQNSSAKLLPVGTISMALYGATIGKLGILTFPAATNQACVNVVTETLLIELQYLFWYLLSQRSAFVERGQGGAQPNISQQIVRSHPIRIAPLNEQRRIVAKLEKLLDKVDSCQKRLAKIPILLKRFRQAVLAAACSGRLTADWRGENRNADSSIINNAVESLPDGNDCPNEWRITNLGTLVKLVTSGSRGWAKYYAKSGAVFIRAQNINSDVLDLDETAYVQLPERSEGLRTKVQLHDILITITGANVTRSALVQGQIEEAYVNQHVALVRLNDIRFSKFVFLSVISPVHGRQQLRSSAYGQGKPGLNLDNIRNVVLALPSLSEQQEIVRRVDELFALADQVEARYAKAKQYVDSLKQSILAKAFRGELVSQDQNDEPATVLIERIQEARGTKTMDRPKPRATKSGTAHQNPVL